MEQLSGSRFHRHDRSGSLERRWLSRVTFHFSGDTFHATADCAPLHGRYSIDEGRFIVRSAHRMDGTECHSRSGGALEADLLLKFLRSRPWVTVDEQSLTLRCRHGSLTLRIPRESEA